MLVDRRNIEGSSLNAFVSTFGPAKLMLIITSIVKKNDHPTPMRKGMRHTLPDGSLVSIGGEEGFTFIQVPELYKHL
jgi:hypothetical protein